MAAVSQPGSRAGLISAMVVAVVVALIMTVMFFVANADAKANAQKLEQLRNQDSPAHLFQLMEGEKKASKKTGKDW